MSVLSWIDGSLGVDIDNHLCGAFHSSDRFPNPAAVGNSLEKLLKNLFGKKEMWILVVE